MHDGMVLIGMLQLRYDLTLILLVGHTARLRQKFSQNCHTSCSLLLLTI